MALKLQSVHGRINENGTRHVRQALLTGETVQRADVLAIITELVQARGELARAKSEVSRVQSVLSTLEREHLEARVTAWNEGWIAGTDALVSGLDPESRILAIVEAQGFNANPYQALLDAPVIEDLPEPIVGEH